MLGTWTFWVRAFESRSENHCWPLKVHGPALQYEVFSLLDVQGLAQSTMRKSACLEVQGWFQVRVAVPECLGDLLSGPNGVGYGAWCRCYAGDTTWTCKVKQG